VGTVTTKEGQILVAQTQYQPPDISKNKLPKLQSKQSYM
jgi:hypothetical protein